MKMRNLGLTGALAILLLPAPAQAQNGDVIKNRLKSLIEKSGIYLSMSTRSSIDNDVDMGPSVGIGYGTAGTTSFCSTSSTRRKSNSASRATTWWSWKTPNRASESKSTATFGG